MALELIFISVETIKDRKKIALPEKADCYRIKSGKVKFFTNDNSALPEKTRAIPSHAEEMSFEGFMTYANWTSYGEARFYDSEGNIIKAE